MPTEPEPRQREIHDRLEAILITLNELLREASDTGMAVSITFPLISGETKVSVRLTD